MHATFGMINDADYFSVRNTYTIQKITSIQYVRGAETKRILLIRRMIH